MPKRWIHWLAVVVGVGWIAWYLGWSSPVQAWLISLANRPETANAFADPITGRTDALLVLVSFFLLTPIFLGIVLLGVIFVMMIFLLLVEPMFRLLRLPLWLAVPVVLAGSATAAYTMRAVWLPDVLYVLGLTAKAGLIYFAAPVAIPR
ncbi:MAG TPA: hypothetical protein VFR64_00025 [Methylomirabilota bacterium]|nr:hypothetical protein [Methylomirabilota bacterium]